MKWSDVLDVGLDVANVAINVNNASQLEELRMQGAATALIQAIIKELRDQIFNYKQVAESILASENESKIISAGAMKVLETRLNKSGITPDLFQELADKEYVANTLKLVRENSNRLFNMLSENEKNTVLNVVSTTGRFPDYNFYLDNYSTGKSIQRSAEIVREYKDRNGCLTQIGIGLYVYPGIAVPVWLAFALGDALSDEWGFVIGGVLGAGLWIFGLVKILKWKNGREYKEAKKIIDSHSAFNLDYFNQLDKEFNGEDVVKQKLAEAQNVAQNFFGNATFLSN